MRDGKRPDQRHVKRSLRNAEGPVETDDSKLGFWLIYCVILLCLTVLSSMHIVIPCGAPGLKAFASPISLIIGNGLHAVFVTFPEFEWAESKQLSIRRGREGEGKEKQSRAMGVRSCFPVRGHTQYV